MKYPQIISCTMYECSWCGTQYTSLKEITKHILKVHGKECGGYNE